jgi:hypothetical protein
MRISNRILVASGAAFTGLGIFATIMLTISAVAETEPGTPERAVSAAPAQTLQSEAHVSRDLVEFESKDTTRLVGSYHPSAVTTGSGNLAGFADCVLQNKAYDRSAHWSYRWILDLGSTIQCAGGF